MVKAAMSSGGYVWRRLLCMDEASMSGGGCYSWWSLLYPDGSCYVWWRLLCLVEAAMSSGGCYAWWKLCLVEAAIYGGGCYV